MDAQTMEEIMEIFTEYQIRKKAKKISFWKLIKYYWMDIKDK